MITHHDTGVSGWYVILVIAIIALVMKLLPRLNAWLEAKIIEQRKEAVREFCRERGFEPNEDDLHAVVTGKGILGARRDS